jgi:hypothetical protein
MNVPLDAQVQCIERELGYRRRVYERLVADGKLTKNKANYEIEVMGAVLETLKREQEKARLI